MTPQAPRDASGSPAGYELLLGAPTFWERLRDDIAGARRRVYVQAMTFEADAAGLPVVEAVLASAATDRRVLVDAYSRVVVSDRFVYGPRALLDRALRREVRATREMFAELERQGVQVRWTNPVGPLLVRFPCRNHKKLMVVDDVAYVGGVNFSDHNFAWHDLMVRIEDPAVVECLADDFKATAGGRSVSTARDFGTVSVLSLDGRDNARHFDQLARWVGGARERIDVVSPYLTFPFTGVLARAVAAGIRVVLHAPAHNNKGIVGDYLAWEASRLGFEVRTVPGMSHMKAIAVDDQALCVGSSNFDFVSHLAQEELMVLIRDRALVEDFRRRVLEAGGGETDVQSPSVHPLRGAASYALLQGAALVTRLSARTRS